MRILFLTLLALVITATTSFADNSPDIIFSQEVIAVNADGTLLPSRTIDPQTMPGVKDYDFDLGRGRTLRIQTNISDIHQRGVDHVADTIRRCYDYIEQHTEHQLNQGVLLYLMEFDEIPYAYSFHSSYSNASQWGQVRLAMIEKGAQLDDIKTPSVLADLLYDTLPHELGHTIMSGIPPLKHDVDGKSSFHTRWFIEGVCETLAKGFSRQEAPELHKHFLTLRHVDKVMADPKTTMELLGWEQNNSNSMQLESDLYGAALLTVESWTGTVPLTTLLDRISSNPNPVRGSDLVSMMTDSTGLTPQEMFVRARSHGTQLSETVLAQANVE